MKSIEKIFSRSADSCGQYLCDESRLAGGNAHRIFFPETAADVAEIVKYCLTHLTPYTVYGKGTGITGGAVPFGGVVIALEKMKNMEHISLDRDSGRFFIKTGPCATLSDLKDLLKRKEYCEFSGHELFYPVDPTEMGASIGGTVATNASGASSFRYGPTRNWVRSLEIVLPDGAIINVKRGEHFADSSGMLSVNGKRLAIPDIHMPQCKNAAGLYSRPGMDLIDLFIGSEGILGTITGVELWLERKLPSISVIKFLESESIAFDFVEALRKSTEFKPVFIEYVDERGMDLLRKKRKNDTSSINIPDIGEDLRTAVFFDLLLDGMDIPMAAEIIGRIENGLGIEDGKSWCAWEDIETERIRAFRHALPETVNTAISEIKKTHPAIHKLGTDLAVPSEKFREMSAFYHGLLDESGLKYVAFGHIGDDHLHINIIPENEDELRKGFDIYKKLAAKAVELKGTVSAEHGIGKIKRNYLIEMYGEKGISEMAGVKSFLDPQWLLNRNNMLEYRERP